MANIKSQIKRIKTNEKAHQRNKAVKSELRTEVRSDDFAALFRWCAFSFCLLRLIWDFMLATRGTSFKVGWE